MGKVWQGRNWWVFEKKPCAFIPHPTGALDRFGRHFRGDETYVSFSRKEPSTAQVQRNRNGYIGCLEDKTSVVLPEFPVAPRRGGTTARCP